MYRLYQHVWNTKVTKQYRLIERSEWLIYCDLQLISWYVWLVSFCSKSSFYEVEIYYSDAFFRIFCWCFWLKRHLSKIQFCSKKQWMSDLPKLVGTPSIAAFYNVNQILCSFECWCCVTKIFEAQLYAKLSFSRLHFNFSKERAQKVKTSFLSQAAAFYGA